VAHPEKKPALAQLARIAALSPRHLTRVFRGATGTTPKQFAAKVKVQVARDLLADPQRTVEAIAESCGFEDARQLRRIWKQSYGMSIATYRTGQRVAEGT
jgi:transcriptional regulator GlxA family with amidase domain